MKKKFTAGLLATALIISSGTTVPENANAATKYNAKNPTKTITSTFTKPGNSKKTTFTFKTSKAKKLTTSNFKLESISWKSKSVTNKNRLKLKVTNSEEDTKHSVTVETVSYAKNDYNQDFIAGVAYGTAKYYKIIYKAGSGYKAVTATPAPTYKNPSPTPVGNNPKITPTPDPKATPTPTPTPKPDVPTWDKPTVPPTTTATPVPTKKPLSKATDTKTVDLIKGKTQTLRRTITTPLQPNIQLTVKNPNEWQYPGESAEIDPNNQIDFEIVSPWNGAPSVNIIKQTHNLSGTWTTELEIVIPAKNAYNNATMTGIFDIGTIYGNISNTYRYIVNPQYDQINGGDSSSESTLVTVNGDAGANLHDVDSASTFFNTVPLYSGPDINVKKVNFYKNSASSFRIYAKDRIQCDIEDTKIEGDYKIQQYITRKKADGTTESGWITLGTYTPREDMSETSFVYGINLNKLWSGSVTGTTYAFRIKSVKHNTVSSTVYRTVGKEDVGIIKIKAEGKVGDQTMISWNRVPNARGYLVEIKEGDETISRRAIDDVNIANAYFTPVPDKTYEIQVHACYTRNTHSAQTDWYTLDKNTIKIAIPAGTAGTVINTTQSQVYQK